MSNTIETKSAFIRYGDTIINRNSIAEVHIKDGGILTQSGEWYHFPSEVIKYVFSDIVDFRAANLGK